jgi:hypothetical protein
VKYDSDFQLGSKVGIYIAFVERMNIPFVLFSIALFGISSIASESLTLREKLENRKISEITVKDRVESMSQSARAELIVSSEKDMIERRDARMGYLEGMRDDKNLKNREEMFRPNTIPRYNMDGAPVEP